MTSSSPGRRERRRGSRVAAGVAAVTGISSALVSAYWACGGTALLDTVGGEIERLARHPEPLALLGLWVIVVLKVGVACAAPVLAAAPGRLPQWTRGRAARGLSWIAASVLTSYGGLLTLVGLLVQAGAIDSSGGDHRALAWHAYLWDPLFLIWGVAFFCCLRLTRPPSPLPRSGRAVPSAGD